MAGYRARTSFSLEGQPIHDGQLLPQAFTDEPGNRYQLDQLLETGAIAPVAEPNQPNG